MTAERLLDLFSGAGGAAKGYQMAGFHVTGVDIAPQPRYCGDAFIQADALEYLAQHGHEYDAIHASPPCEAYSVVSAIRSGFVYPDLVAPTREMLEQVGKPWVIENVPGAPLRATLMLCGSMFGLRVKRHRLFEANWALGFPPFCCDHQKGKFLDMYSSGKARKGTERGYCDAMGVTWAPVTVATDSIPPAYTEFIGRALMAYLGRE